MRDPRVDPKPGDAVVITEFGPPPDRYEVVGRTSVGIVYTIHGERRWMSLQGWKNVAMLGEVIHAAAD